MTTDFLKNVWYAAALSADLSAQGEKKSKLISRVILNEPIVIYRTADGKAKALRDICPHRGIPLSYGRVVQDQLECPYHGWKFNCEGTCTEIPSLLPDQGIEPQKIKIKFYPVKEQQGVIWVFIPDWDMIKSREELINMSTSNSIPEIPLLKKLPINAKPQIALVENFSCHVDHAVIGLMDPAHGPYVHKSIFWRSEKTTLEKAKKFAPVPFGFQMVRHQPSKNSKAYKILGGTPTTEITFTLPGVRVEHIEVGVRNLYSFTLLTPVGPNQTRIHQLLYWDMPWLSLIKPFVKKFAHFFLHQDITAVNQQQDGLRFDPSLMLIRDADTQAKWYYALKDSWMNFQKEKTVFQHPVSETVLRWRS